MGEWLPWYQLRPTAANEDQFSRLARDGLEDRGWEGRGEGADVLFAALVPRCHQISPQSQTASLIQADEHLSRELREVNIHRKRNASQTPPTAFPPPYSPRTSP